MTPVTFFIGSEKIFDDPKARILDLGNNTYLITGYTPEPIDAGILSNLKNEIGAKFQALPKQGASIGTTKTRGYLVRVGVINSSAREGFTYEYLGVELSNKVNKKVT